MYPTTLNATNRIAYIDASLPSGTHFHITASSCLMDFPTIRFVRMAAMRRLVSLTLKMYRFNEFGEKRNLHSFTLYVPPPDRLAKRSPVSRARGHFVFADGGDGH